MLRMAHWIYVLQHGIKGNSLEAREWRQHFFNQTYKTDYVRGFVSYIFNIWEHGSWKCYGSSLIALQKVFIFLSIFGSFFTLIALWICLLWEPYFLYLHLFQWSNSEEGSLTSPCQPNLIPLLGPEESPLWQIFKVSQKYEWESSVSTLVPDHIGLCRLQQPAPWIRHKKVMSTQCHSLKRSKSGAF